MTCACCRSNSLLPRSLCRCVSVQVGAPIAVPHCAEPSLEALQQAHAQYVAALEGIFHAHKAAYGMADVVLRIA